MSKVNRNAPCPCGSGKKYKKCCGQTRSKQIKATHVKSVSSMQSLFKQHVEPTRSEGNILKQRSITKEEAKLFQDTSPEREEESGA